jgi:hypothetical protein
VERENIVSAQLQEVLSVAVRDGMSELVGDDVMRKVGKDGLSQHIRFEVLPVGREIPEDPCEEPLIIESDGAWRQEERHDEMGASESDRQVHLLRTKETSRYAPHKVMSKITCAHLQIRASVIAFLALVPYQAVAQKAGPVRIEVKRGTFSTTLRGRLRGRQQMEYALAARDGQTLSVDLVCSPAGSLTVRISDPRGMILLTKPLDGRRWTATLQIPRGMPEYPGSSVIRWIPVRHGKF